MKKSHCSLVLCNYFCRFGNPASFRNVISNSKLRYARPKGPNLWGFSKHIISGGGGGRGIGDQPRKFCVIACRLTLLTLFSPSAPSPALLTKKRNNFITVKPMTTKLREFSSIVSGNTFKTSWHVCQYYRYHGNQVLTEICFLTFVFVVS